VLGGGNDLFAEIGSSDTPTQQANVAVQAAANIATCVQTLYDDGARNVIVSNLPDLGQIPRYRGSSQQTQASQLTATFDTALANDLTALSPTTAGLKLSRLDLLTLFQQLMATPSAFGLTDVKDSAYTGDTNDVGNGTAVADPSGYLFWDDVHPTAAGHQLIANAAYTLAVPEPTSVGLFVAVIALGTRRRRQYKSSTS
jgi:outer membrane lipase/esterase